MMHLAACGLSEKEDRMRQVFFAWGIRAVRLK